MHCHLQEGKGPEGTRGGRVVWVLGGKYLAVTGFDRYQAFNSFTSTLVRCWQVVWLLFYTSIPLIIVSYNDNSAETSILCATFDSLVARRLVSFQVEHAMCQRLPRERAVLAPAHRVAGHQAGHTHSSLRRRQLHALPHRPRECQARVLTGVERNFI